MAKRKKEKREICLEDGSIFNWERPLKKGHISTAHMYNASTKIIEYKGLDTIEKEIGKYCVVASAAKYLAEILRFDKEKPVAADYDEKRKPKEEILFSGGIQIYEEGVIPGTEIEGRDLKTNGKIWYAMSPTSLVMYGGLNYIIFGNTSTDKGNISRIEAIIRGYETQKEEEEKAKDL